MKFAATISMSLLLLGVCSARSTMWQTSGLRPMDDMKTNDQNSQQMDQHKRALYQKSYQQLGGIHFYPLDQLPQLTDPLPVGATVDRQGMLIVNYDNVQFVGLNSSGLHIDIVDTNTQKAILLVSMRHAEIQGHYNASDGNSGAFSIKLSGLLVFATHFPYEIVDNSVHLVNTSGRMIYTGHTNDYEDAHYDAETLKVIQQNLWLLTNERVHQEMFLKFGEAVKENIRKSISNEHAPGYSADEVMQKGKGFPATGLRSMDATKGKDSDYSKPAQDYPREDGQYKSNDQNSQQMDKLQSALYQKLLGGIHFYPFDQLPQLTDPLPVGATVDRQGMLIVNYDNVQFVGLNSSGLHIDIVDTNSQSAVLLVSMRNAEIQGHYNASDGNSGAFSIKLSGFLVFATHFPYEIVDNSVHLVNTSGRMIYTGHTNDYENAHYDAETLKVIQQNLWLLTNERVHQEMFAKFGEAVKENIQKSIPNEEVPEYSVDKAMQKDINNAVNGIQQVISKHGDYSIDLTSDNKQMSYNKLHAKIASIKLNGIEKFYMAGNHISKEKADRTRANVELAVDRPTATAVVSIQEGNNEDAPFQKITVDFELEKLMADLQLDKSARQSGLELRSVQAKVNRIWPVNTQKFEGQVNNLIKEKLTDHMKHCIEEGLKNYIQNGLSNFMQRGVLPPSQENRFARIRM